MSDGVPAFKPPEAKNARIVLAWLGVILVTLFMGITFLARHYHLTPIPAETVVSQLARQIFGGGLLYYEIQAVTMLILILAANTSFADFPRLSYFLARDGFIPRQFGTRGDRLVFSNGILILGGTAAGLVIVFGGETHALIPLYALGVFISFTLSQASMVRRWLVLREEGWWWRWWLNAVGAATTGVVMLVIGATKFADGAWIVMLLIPILVLIFLMVHRHYADVARQLSLEGYAGPPPIEHTVLVLVGDLHKGVAAALRYAQALSLSVKAVYVELDPDRTRAARGEVGQVRARHPARRPDLAVPVAARALPRLRQPPARARPKPRGDDRDPRVRPRPLVAAPAAQPDGAADQGALLFRKGVVVVDVPFHLKQ